MINIVTKQIIGLIIAAVFGALVSHTRAKRLSTRQAVELSEKQSEAADLAVFTLIKSQLVAEWSRVNAQGFVYLHDLESINALNCVYMEMNGNGAVKLLMQDIESLERRTTKRGVTSVDGFHLDKTKDDRSQCLDIPKETK